MFEKKFKSRRKVKDRSLNSHQSESNSKKWRLWWLIAIILAIAAFVMTYLNTYV